MRPFLSLGSKLAATTTLVVAVVSGVLFTQISGHERERLIESKRTAATMLAHLVSSSLSATLDFGDSADLESALGNLRSNPDISGAAVWGSGQASASAGWQRVGVAPLSAPSDESPEVSVSSQELEVVESVVAPGGARVGRLKILFSLARENDVYAETRLRILLFSVALAVATAALLVLLARWQIVTPIARLAQAAGRLARGDLTVRVAVSSGDEIGDLANAFNSMSDAVAFRQKYLEQEMQLAQRIQTSILPRNLQVPGLDLSASMRPAAEVGGDYYDVLPLNDGCWIGIGDVAGHGLNAGLIMLMLQSTVAALVHRNQNSAPRDVVTGLNAVLYQNIQRLDKTEHATFTLLRYRRDGRVEFAGAHEDIVVCRAAGGLCETIATEGPWIAGVPDIADITTNHELQLNSGDVMVLYTDGAIEALDDRGEMFGLDRLCAEVRKVREQSSDAIRESVMNAVMAWASHVSDDITVLVAKYSSA